jgi:hypothetical protein
MEAKHGCGILVFNFGRFDCLGRLDRGGRHIWIGLTVGLGSLWTAACSVRPDKPLSGNSWRQFTRVTACTLALSPIRDTLIEGFSHFVTSMTAPIASGWSGSRVGLAPTGKRRLFTAHTHMRHYPRSTTILSMRVSVPIEVLA